MKYLLLLLLLAGCSSTTLREGPIVPTPIQAKQQCKVQPEVGTCVPD